jgi:hypothetical protein
MSPRAELGAHSRKFPLLELYSVSYLSLELPDYVVSASRACYRTTAIHHYVTSKHLDRNVCFRASLRLYRMAYGAKAFKSRVYFHV